MQSVQAKTYHKTKPQEELPLRSQRKIVKKSGNVVYGNGFADRKVRQPSAKVKSAVKRRPKVKSGIASTLIVLFIAFCALTLLVSRYAGVCSIGSQNNEMRSQLKAIEAKIDNLAVDIELKDDIDYIHSSAQADLGMKYPDQSQRITIKLDGR